MTPSDPTAAGPKRGAGLLLEHVRMSDDVARDSALQRLEATIGRELSSLLVSALTTRAKRRTSVG
jgi:hypothetical protein